jgi:hypothetical protein
LGLKEAKDAVEDHFLKAGWSFYNSLPAYSSPDPTYNNF